jgi:hypothetical protein
MSLFDGAEGVKLPIERNLRRMGRKGHKKDKKAGMASAHASPHAPAHRMDVSESDMGILKLHSHLDELRPSTCPVLPHKEVKVVLLQPAPHVEKQHDGQRNNDKNGDGTEGDI